MQGVKYSPAERLINGIFKENPTFIMIIGMCPALAVTTSAVNGIGMGLSTTLILVASNTLISMLRRVIPDKVRIPAYIGIIATFVTIVEFLLDAYLPALATALGVYIPLIVVNCIILGRAEAFAGKNKVLPSVFDGLGMGLGFTLAIFLIGFVRELLGTGAVFGYRLLPADVEAIGFFQTSPGAFFVLGIIIAFIHLISARRGKGTSKKAETPCAACGNSLCENAGMPEGEESLKDNGEIKDGGKPE